MGLHILRRTQIVPASIEQCWAFFSNPGNLARITPPRLDFRVLSEFPPAIYAGMMIQYRVRPLFGIAMTWVSEIAHVDAPRYFVDEQKIGPYAIWHHEHHLRKLDAERTEICDVVHYAPPFGWLGEFVHPILIAPELEKIFTFREQAVRALFETKA